MRRFGIAVTAAGLIFGAAMVTAVRAETVTVATAASSAQPTATSPVIKASCFRNGWGGWGTYPSCEKRVKKKRHKGMHKDK